MRVQYNSERITPLRALIAMNFITHTDRLGLSKFHKFGFWFQPSRWHMAKKKSSQNSDRSNPENNKSLAIRRVLKKMPHAKAADVIAAVKNDYGLDVGMNLVYMVKTKGNISTASRADKSTTPAKKNRLTTATLWVDAIRMARQLLKATGSLENATALLKALADK